MTDKPQDWAPEPWTMDNREVWCADKDRRYPVIRHTPDPYIDYDCIDRIVACVNASRGISQEVLERIANGRGFSDIIQSIMQQKFPDYEGHWTQQFEEEATDER